ncbi:mevalonate kinase [Nocardia sp. NPDC005746]|uniref:mevalonate kinase n=1 Tax=Nocardia sp. NPDC005746 TaxID=3157062 RepID=UPI0033D92CFD
MAIVSPRHRVGDGSAHAKVILIGEHTVVHGSAAIALPIPAMTAHARAAHASNSAAARLVPEGRPGVLRIGGPGFRPRTGPELAVDAALRRWKITGTPLTVRTDTRIPVARGLGSSAAVTAAAIRATAALVEQSLSDTDLAAFVQVGGQHSHGRAGGVDAAAAVSRGPIQFRAGVHAPIPIAGRALLLVADTGVGAGTREAVGIASARLTGQSGLELLRSAETLTESAITQLAQGDWKAVGRSLTAFHELLANLGVSSHILDRGVAAALEAGALGAKLTGGGLGGCLLALTDHPDTATGIRERLHHSGVRHVWTLPIEGSSK